MQIAISLDYDSITFKHDVLIEADITAMSLQYYRNCGTISSTIDLTSLISNVENNSITVPITNIDSTKTLFDDGVYRFILTVVGPSIDGDPGSYILKGCAYIGTTSRCKALCLYKETKNELIRYVINALTIVNDCDDCDCSTQCELYNYLLSLLNNKSINTNVYKSCGCD